MDSSNPLIANIRLPGRIFQLPSRGFFYRNGELSDSVKDGEIHVHPMSALDEINMKNPDQLFSGEAVNTVFKHCVSGIEKPAQLLAKDVDAIMLFLRAVTYGNDYEFLARHTCEGAKEHSYVANLEQIINEIRMIDPTMVDELYTVNLQNGQTVKMMPSRYQNVVDLIKNNEGKREITAQDEQNNLLIMLLGIIQSVDGISDKTLIKEWASQIPAPMVNKIGRKIENINDWGSTMKWTCTCRDCGESFTVDIPINPVSFFTE